MSVDYTIVSKPDYISFNCPHCGGGNIKANFSDVDFKTDCWGDGAFVDCPECEIEVELGQYDYD